MKENILMYFPYKELKEMQIKTSIKYHHIGMATMKKLTILTVDRETEQLQFSYINERAIKCYNLLKTVCQLLKS